MRKTLLLLILTLFSFSAIHADDNGSCGDNLTWKFTSSDGTLTISGTGNMTNFGDYRYVPWGSLRNEIKKGTELGKTAQSYIDKGNLIPDDLMVSILAKVYDEFGRGHKGVIFDGFPRTIPQAEALKKMLDERGDKVAAMIELDVPEDELMKRLILRGQQSGRADDNEETIKKRLVVYHSQTQPLIEWYKQEGLHHHIDGLGTLERIFADICNVIDSL
jgi:adenylate kinase